MKTTTSRFAAPLFIAGAAAASSLVFAAVGCGSGGGSAPSGLPVLSASSSGSGGTTLASFLGRAYSSQFALADGQVGTLSVSVAADSTASGTLQIVDPTRKVTVKSRLVIATPFISGTFDPQTGAINLTGSYTIGGQTIPVSIVGTLPTPPSTTGGSLTTTINGQAYTSPFGGSPSIVNPTPTPTGSASPSPSPSANPTPSPSASPSPTSGAVSFTVVSKTPDCNFSDANFKNLTVSASKFQGVAAGASSLYLFTSTLQGNRTNNSFRLGFQRLKTSVLVPETFTFTPSPALGAFGDDFQGILQTGITAELDPTGFSVGVWEPSGGTLIVESVVGTKITVRGSNVEFSPNRFNAIKATGKFTADFTVTYDNVTGL